MLPYLQFPCSHRQYWYAIRIFLGGVAHVDEKFARLGWFRRVRIRTGIASCTLAFVEELAWYMLRIWLRFFSIGVAVVISRLVLTLLARRTGRTLGHETITTGPICNAAGSIHGMVFIDTRRPGRNWHRPICSRKATGTVWIPNIRETVALTLDGPSGAALRRQLAWIHCECVHGASKLLQRAWKACSLSRKAVQKQWYDRPGTCEVTARSASKG